MKETEIEQKTENKSNKRLTTKQQKFVEAVTDPRIKSNTEAALIAGYSPNTARKHASLNMTKGNILREIEKRRAQHRLIADVEKTEVIGSAVRTFYSSIDDVIDEKGNFDIEKARATGGIHQIKKISRRMTEWGENVSIEMYSAADARRELTEILGLKQQPRENEEKLQKAAQATIAYLEEFPEVGLDYAIKIFAKGREVLEEELRARVTKELRNTELIKGTH